MFDQSFQEWLARHPGGTRQQWSDESRALWARIVASPHFHGGVPCAAEPTCKNYRPRIEGAS